MPGITYCKSKIAIDDIKSFKQDMNYSSTIELNSYIETENELFFSNYAINYPNKEYVVGSYIVLISGMIYNFTDDDLLGRLKDIIDNIGNNQSFLRKIKNFVGSADGDYILVIYSKVNDFRFIFNDILGRLPLYYYEGENGLCISSEFKAILRFSDNVEFNIFEVVNKVTLGYTLGKNTIYNNVYNIQPGELLCVGQGFAIEKFNTTQIDYLSVELYKTKMDAIKDIKNHFFESIENRVNKVERLGYRVISDLSGGFDSRAVIGGVSKFCRTVNYYTFEYTHDESPIAFELFNTLEQPGKYKKLKFENKLDIQETPRVLFNLDCLTNYYTSYICYKDVDFLYHSEALGKTVRFGGLGGEFFRHPYNTDITPRAFAILDGSYKKELEDLSSILNFQVKDYKSYLSTYFKSYAGTHEQQLKKLYVEEYYRIEVGTDAEDRERIHFWGVQPFWTVKLVRAFNNVPLSWINYDFFTQIMNEIDSKLLEVDIFGSDINLKSARSRYIYDLKSKVKLNIIQFLTKKLPQAKSLIKKNIYKGRSEKVNSKDITEEAKFIMDKYSSISKYKYIFNESLIYDYLKSNERNAMIDSYIIYINTIESKYC